MQVAKSIMVEITHPLLMEILTKITKEIEKTQKELDINLTKADYFGADLDPNERNVAFNRLRERIKRIAKEI